MTNGKPNALNTMPQHDQSQRPPLELSPQSQSSTPYSTYGKPMRFNLQHKVFLSHSGLDKEFAWHLHKALSSSFHGIKVAISDEETVLKAEAVYMENILEEARTSKLCVLVLTDDFFTHTQKPMLELEAFVAAEVNLLPLFLTMSVEQFKEKERRDSWVKKWRDWSAVDDKLVNLESWGHALSLVSKFCGLEFCKTATNQSDFIDKVVKQVTSIIGSAIPISKGGVIHGKDRLCQMVDHMYKEATSKRFSLVKNTTNHTQAASSSSGNSGCEEDYQYITGDVVGIHGFPGLGKTTLCKWLCDFYHQELGGRVCYIDVGSSHASLVQHSASLRGRRLQHVLNSLSPNNNGNNSDHVLYLSNDQLENLLRKEFSLMKDPVFLAIDSIHSEWESQEEAEWYLGCEFPEGSKIFIISRSESILANLSDQYKYRFSVVTAYMPRLTFEEARDIFVQEFPGLSKLGLTNLQEEDVNECVNVCTIHREWYHPLMLKSLAAFIRWGRSTWNVDWKGRLAIMRSKGIDDINDDVWRKVFSVFEMTYQLLSGEARKVFLDLAIATHTGALINKYEWINMLHSHLRQKTLEEILLKLQDACFIDKERFEYKNVPDLLVDFVKYKAWPQGKYLKTSSGQMITYPEVLETYVVVDASTPWLDRDRLPSRARHISISRVHCKASQTQLDLTDVEGVEVLHLVDNAGLQEVLLSPTTCAHLRSLIVIVPGCTRLRCILNEDWPSLSPMRRGGQFLKWMQLQGNVSFQLTGASQLSEARLVMGSNGTNFHSLAKLEIHEAVDTVSILACPPNLESLDLRWLPNVQSIDVTICANLKNVDLTDMRSLKFIHGFEGNSHQLERVYIYDCRKLLALTMPANSGARYDIRGCRSLKTLSRWAGSGAECRRITGVDGLSQFTGHLTLSGDGINRSYAVRLEDFFGRFLSKDAAVNCSMCKAKVIELEVNGYKQAGVAGVVKLHLGDAQNIGFFISAWFKAQPEELQRLEIRCKRGGDCGCDQNAPYFGPLPMPDVTNPIYGFYHPHLRYSCPQVRDLASLAQWHVLKELHLNGCTNVEVWPDFAAMTSLVVLVLSNTSLKEWPGAVLLLPNLVYLDLSGCRDLPATELIMNGAIAAPESRTFGHLTCKGCSLASLTKDLREGTRDRGSVADALDALSPELEILLDRWSTSVAVDILLVQRLVVEIMYLVWFGYIDENRTEQKSLPEEEWQYIRRKMRGLLCSKSFLSLPFLACYELSLTAVAGWEGWSMFIELQDWDEMKYRLREKEKLELDGLAGIGLKGIAMVGGAMSLGASLDKTCILNLFQNPIDDELKRSYSRWGKNAHNLGMQVRAAEVKMQALL